MFYGQTIPKAYPQVHRGQARDIDKGLVGHWTFDGGAQDVSGNGNDGTVNGGAVRTRGIIRGAYKFDGSDDYIKANASFFPTATSPLTLSVWIKPNKTQSTDQVGIIGWDAGTSDTGKKRMICIRSNGKIYFWGNSADFNPPNLYWDANIWQHIVLTITAGKLVSFYKNGIFADSGVIDALADVDTNNSIYIAFREAFTQYFSGLISDARIYNRALSPAEIRQLYLLGVNRIGFKNYLTQLLPPTAIRDIIGSGMGIPFPR